MRKLPRLPAFLTPGPAVDLDAWRLRVDGLVRHPLAMGYAEVLAQAKNVSVEGLARMGLAEAARGKARLTLREGYEDGWDPREQARLTAWETCQRLIWALNKHGEHEAGRLARRLGGLADQAKDLAYRLYGIADRKGWTDEALGYNVLVASWPEIQKHATAAAGETQGRMV